jgi:hypothetical protein
VCLAECLGNSLLADTLRDFTARTTLIAMLYQSSHDAAQSCAEHVQIVDALEARRAGRAERADVGAHRHRAGGPALHASTTRWPSCATRWRRCRSAAVIAHAAQDLHTSSQRTPKAQTAASPRTAAH